MIDIAVPQTDRPNCVMARRRHGMPSRFSARHRRRFDQPGSRSDVQAVRPSARPYCNPFSLDRLPTGIGAVPGLLLAKMRLLP